MTDLADPNLEHERRVAHTGAQARMAGHFARHPWRVIFSWIAIFVVLIGLNVAFHGTLINDFNLPGTDVQRATDLINAKFPVQKGAALRVVVAAPPGQRLDTPQGRAAIQQMIAAGTTSQRSLDFHAKDVSTTTDPLAKGAHQLSKDGRIAFFDIQYDKTGFQLPRAGIVNLENNIQAIASKAGIDAQFTGEAENAPPTQGLSDIIGLIAAFIILMILFRALVPTLIPLLFAITAVAGAFMLLYLAARFTHFNTVTEILVPMIGLGVGIDYTLFIVTRFRQFLHDGLTPQEAAAAASATAGRAVLFAGTTVAISITGLALIGIDFITKLGIGSALGVLTAVLLANSLLPAILSLLGHKIDRGGMGLRGSDESREGQLKTPVAAGAGSSPRIAKVVLPVTVVILLVVASPVHQGAARPGRRRHGAEEPDDAQGVRPALAGLRPGLHLADPGRGRAQLRPQRRGQAAARLPAHARASRRSSRRSTTPRPPRGVGGDRQRLLEVQAAGREDRRHRLDLRETR